jgi:PAS domain S-box-containing protein
MALSDPHGTVLAVNSAYCALYGFGAAELVDQPFWIIFPSDRREWAAREYAAVFASDVIPAAFEATVQRRDGDVRSVESRVSFITRDGKRVAMLSIILDITRQKQAVAAAERLARENAVLYAQATETLRSRDEFIAMASHELKNPLTALRAFAEILQRRGTYEAKLVDGVVLQVRRLERLIQNMLDSSLAESGHLQIRRSRVDLVALVELAVAQTRELTRQHEIRFTAPSHPVVGDWDADRLDQVVQNLLSNAVKYSPAGGEILVSVDEGDTAVRVSVMDHGKGIPEEAIPHLFTRFYRTSEAAASNAGGLGLGLSVARMLVEAHSGQLDVRSRLGEGTTFTVTLPYQPDLTTEGGPAWKQ